MRCRSESRARGGDLRDLRQAAGQLHSKLRPAAYLAGNGDAAAVRFGDGSRHEQTYPQPFEGGGRRSAFEVLEDARLILRRDSDAVIADPENRQVSVFANPELNGPARAVFERVGKEVHDELLDLVAI